MPPFDLNRLCQSIRHARLSLEYQRANRVRMVRAVAGPEWSAEVSADLAEPVNLIDLYIKVVSPSLISQSPRVLLSTFNSGGKASVGAMQRWLNQEIERSGFCETMQRAVTDALFSVGIVKVALGTPADAAESAWGLEAGQPFVELVDLDDFVFDVHARHFDEASFIGHRVRRPLVAVRDSKLYSKRRKKLTPSRDPFYNQEGDQRVNVLGRGFWGGNGEEFEDMVDLWEIYLPRHRLVVTLESDDAGNPEMDDTYEPLRQVEWLGPECGPYHILGYGVVPGNAMPKAPVQNLFKLHEVVNHVYRKLIRQAERQKTNLFVQGGADADGNRIVNAPDGEAIRVDNPESVSVHEWGSPNAMNFQFGDHLKQLFSYMACNMDAAGGLSPQSKTAAQDRMLSESSSRVLQDMQNRTVAYTAQVLKSLCWYYWNHPTNEYAYEHKPRGMARGRTRTLYPGGAVDQYGNAQPLRRNVPFDQLDLRIAPYSVVASSPDLKLQRLNTLVQMWAPFAPLSAQQGVVPDWNFFFGKVAEYMDEPDILDFLTVREPVGAGGGEPPAMPQQSERRYVRENVPMRTERGASQQLQARLSGVETGGAAQPQGVGA